MDFSGIKKYYREKKNSAAHKIGGASWCNGIFSNQVVPICVFSALLLFYMLYILFGIFSLSNVYILAK